MLRALLRWGIPLGALFVVGPFAGWITYSLKAPDGGPETTLFLSAPLFNGLLAGAAVIVLAAAVGLVGARVNDARNGLTAAGFVMAWGAWGLSRIDLVLGRVQNGAALWTLALEGAFVGALSVAAAWAIFRIRPIAWKLPALADPPDSPHSHHHHHPEPTAILDATLPLAFGAAILAGGVVAWFMAADTLKGQTFAAALLGGLFAAAAGRVISQRVSGLAFVGAIAVLAIAGPAIGAQVHPGGAVVAARAGKLFALARPLPLDWMAGAFVGVPIGLAWAGSMVERKHHEKKA